MSSDPLRRVVPPPGRGGWALVLLLAAPTAAGCAKKEPSAPAGAEASGTEELWGIGALGAAQVGGPEAAGGPVAVTQAGATEREVPPLPPVEPPARPLRVRFPRDQEAAAGPAAGAAEPAGGLAGLPGLASLPGIPSGDAAGMQQMMGALAASVEEVPERPGFPRWERLAPFLPDQVGEFVAAATASGTTARAMGMSITSATRRYAAGARAAEVAISGGDVAELAGMELRLRVPDQNAVDHVRRRVTVAGYPAIVEWSRDGGQAEARMVVADLYKVGAKVSPVDGPEPALALLQALDLAGLARLR